eukprot:m.77976 g.77976  ORF g.77976 m.77976 type:complete len:531 (+) comp13230_c0_seq2:515-2107(+)
MNTAQGNVKKHGRRAKKHHKKAFSAPAPVEVKEEEPSPAAAVAAESSPALVKEQAPTPTSEATHSLSPPAPASETAAPAPMSSEQNKERTDIAPAEGDPVAPQLESTHSPTKMSVSSQQGLSPKLASPAVPRHESEGSNQWRGVLGELGRRGSSRSSSTISNPGSHASASRTTSTVSHGLSHASPRASAGAVSSTTIADTDQSMLTPLSASRDLLAPAGNSEGFGLRHFPGHQPHRDSRGARFNTTNVSFVPDGDLDPDGSSTEEENTDVVAHVRALMRLRDNAVESQEGRESMDVDPEDQQRDERARDGREGDSGSSSSSFPQHSSESQLHASSRPSGLSGPGSSNEQRAGERDWASNGEPIEFLGWKNPPSTLSPQTTALPHHDLSPAGARRSNPVNSGVLIASELHPGPEDCVVAPDAAITQATVPIDHATSDSSRHLDIRASPEAMRHEHMRGVLGQQDPLHVNHFYPTDTLGAGSAGAGKQSDEALMRDKLAGSQGSTSGGGSGGGVSGPDSEVARDPCHLAMWQ